MEAFKKIIKHQLEFNSDQTFIKNDHQKLSFKEFKTLVLNISQELRAIQLFKNDLVLLDIKDPFYFAAYTFACFQLRLRPAFLNSFMKKDQIATILKDNTYGLFISDQDHSDFKTVRVDTKRSFNLSPNSEVFNIEPSSELIFFTSGSIKSKACVLTLENFLYSAAGSSENIPFNENNNWGLCLPLFHVGGFSILIRSILSNGTVIALNTDRNFSDQILENNITHISFVSTQFMRFLEQYKHMSSLNFVLLGGSAIPLSSISMALKFKLPIYKSYGMTEMASQICTTTQIENLDQAVFSGHVLKYRELKIVDNKISVKGPCLFKGYLYKNKIESPSNGEWFLTGDLGELHDGQIKILGRSDRIFQSAGENISPEFIELELLKIPGVFKAYVCPVADDTYGLRAMAYIESELKAEEINKLLEGKLSGLHRLKELRPWSELPKTSWKQ